MSKPPTQPGLTHTSYRHQSMQPLVSLVFITPMLLIYEVGMVLLGPDALRNGAEVWLRRFLDLLGFGEFLFLPALACGILLAWHHISRQPWNFQPSILGGMLIESTAFAGALVVIAQLQHQFMQSLPVLQVAANAPEAGQTKIMAYLVGYFGAGIYEELLFRLMLLPALVAIFRWSGMRRGTSLVTAIVLSSLLFSAAHYDFVTTGGETFALNSFVFRFLAGSVFSLLFVYRGMGIAVGSHAFYDVVIAIT
ncbi:MAG: CPBP family intramembrane metalloprotease [Pirellulaceae bacterium]|nr:CPBP family intramembrane metalloprotease [Pirellulaceae bacterium]